MAVTDPIADMLTKIRNAIQAEHDAVIVWHSKIKESIAFILKEHGFIEKFEVTEEDKKKSISIDLKYGPKKQKVVLGLKRVSKCGRRYYVGKDNIPLIQGGLGVAILSTSKGIITDKEAREKEVGGEVICYVW